MFDLIIKNGTVVDGTGCEGYGSDVGIQGDKISSIGNLDGVDSHKELDAEGLVVAPGFIDIHSHSDFTLLVDPRAQSAVSQGVTTEIIGNCGHGCAPITDPARFTGNIYGYTPDVDIQWNTTAEFFETLQSANPAVNVIPLVPNGNLRIAAMGEPEKQASSSEFKQMVKMLEEGLEAGAWGLSNGLEYTSERATTEEEMIELCKIVTRSGGLFSTHERNKDLFAVEAIEEGIRVARASEVRLQLSHIIPRRSSPVGSVQKVMDVVQDAHDAGMDVGFDAHTRLHGIMNITAALPNWAFEGGPKELEKRLNDKNIRELLKKHESIVSGKNTVGWDRVFLYTSFGSPDMVGKSFAELVSDGRDVFDVIFDVILSEKDDPHRSLIISHSYEEEWLRQTFVHPLCTPASDATALCKDGPLSETVFLGAYTWASWFFNKFVNEFGEYTVEQAVNKLTAVPAKQAGISDRGRIDVGCAADITVFDPKTFKENGTLYDPNHFADGVQHVIVNGGLTMEDGRFSTERFGQVLRRR